MRLLSLLILLILTGCASRPLQVTALCPKPNLPVEPHYPIADLKQGDDKAKVAKAWVASFQGCYDYSHQLRYVAGGYE